MNGCVYGLWLSDLQVVQEEEILTLHSSYE